jgi:hypothetical protein
MSIDAEPPPVIERNRQSACLPAELIAAVTSDEIAQVPI